MDDSTTTALIIARFLASAINPALAVMLMAVPFDKLRRHGGTRSTVSRSDYLKWVVFCATAVAIPVVLAEMGKKRQIWHGHAGFPSGHETFATAAATCLVIKRPRLIAPVLAIVVVMGWSLVRAGYHEFADVLGASVLGPIGAIATSFAFRMRQERFELEPT